MKLSDYKYPVLVLPNIDMELELWEFYNYFINLVTKENEQHLYIMGTEEEFTRLTCLKDNENIKSIEISDDFYKDNWVRDYAPVICKNNVNFVYDPSYYEEDDRELTEELDDWSYEFLDEEEFEASDIVLDGGNFIYNGEDDAIISVKIFEDNCNLGYDALLDELREVTGIKNFRFIGYDPYDETGHADGYVRFVDKQHVLVAALSDDYSMYGSAQISEDEYYEIKDVLDGIANQLEVFYKVTRIIHGMPAKEHEDSGMDSVVGGYINYMKIENKIYLPQFEMKELDDAAIEVIQKVYGAGITVVPVNCLKLAPYGGLLNCISWNC